MRGSLRSRVSLRSASRPRSRSSPSIISPRLEQEPGYCGVWAGIDYTGGRAIAVTYWESIDALHHSDALASEVRAAAVTKAGVDRNRPPIIDRYEIVLEQRSIQA